LFDYLRSPQGHEVAMRVVGVIEAVQRDTLQSGGQQQQRGMQYTHRERFAAVVIQALVVTLAMLAAGFLSYHSKLDTTLGVFLATTMGYFLGRRTS
jgi:hypothetical protein